jgi:hypothetical protein
VLDVVTNARLLLDPLGLATVLPTGNCELLQKKNMFFPIKILNKQQDGISFSLLNTPLETHRPPKERNTYLN